ncbi:hypothetical protein M2284_001517 [Rhodococcus sp. LBL1]|uniref:Uncharacterized protein n=1 Tax=Prescottella agglutinans TaxID=1644129 RepID=A0ABT6MJ29_9NOCA|nr:hypothetical protein [Prescottella agglutinans]MDH6677319.1 hypothetical protein [Rhodococcus sp. LBL1]MDH6682387.1 hypothetical protein [Rhodococcus sp. LBL2]
MAVRVDVGATPSICIPVSAWRWPQSAEGPPRASSHLARPPSTACPPRAHRAVRGHDCRGRRAGVDRLRGRRRPDRADNHHYDRGHHNQHGVHGICFVVRADNRSGGGADPHRQPRRGGDTSPCAARDAAGQGPRPEAGYSRDAFGQAWTDNVTVDGGHNGCDTRNDILHRDLIDITLKPGSNNCTVLTGTLHDTYTGSRLVTKLRH